MNNLKLRNTPGIEYWQTSTNSYNGTLGEDDYLDPKNLFAFPSVRSTNPQSEDALPAPYNEESSETSNGDVTSSSGQQSLDQKPITVDWDALIERGVGPTSAASKLDLQDLINRGLADPNKLGKVIYAKSNMDVGNMQHIIDAFRFAGISIRVTSGLRPGAKTKQGKNSWHASGNAIDITPIDGDFAKFERQIREHPDLVDYLKRHGVGILREYYVGGPTGSTGKHVHVGKDTNAIKDLERIINGQEPILHGKFGGAIPIIDNFEPIRLKRR